MSYNSADKYTFLISMNHIIFFLSLFLLPSLNLKSQSNTYASEELEIINLINRHRSSIGKKALKIDSYLSRIAYRHSKNMAYKRIQFGHFEMRKRLKKIINRYEHFNSYAENVATKQKTPREVVESWLNSPTHRENIEGNYNFCGISIVCNPQGQKFYTHIFVNGTP